VGNFWEQMDMLKQNNEALHASKLALAIIDLKKPFPDLLAGSFIQLNLLTIEQQNCNGCAA
jgi:hypothetical protein